MLNRFVRVPNHVRESQTSVPKDTNAHTERFAKHWDFNNQVFVLEIVSVALAKTSNMLVFRLPEDQSQVAESCSKNIAWTISNLLILTN